MFFTNETRYAMASVCKVLCFVIYFGTVTCNSNYEENEKLAFVEVETTYGRVRGQRLQDRLRRTYDEFRGIPFAKPPVEELRWEKPLPPESWTDVRNATEFSIHCTHFIAPFYALLGFGGEHGEDCLYLNIYVPHGVGEVESLPVMVYYYGGAFILGTGEMYPGMELALFGNVIVVTFNYRVSTLGWLSSGSNVLPGNYGLWDARAALQWVQENIANFGGNPNQVTIFGQSAGGAMVSHSVISPQFEGLFQRAMAFSGAATSFFSLTRQPRGSLLMMADIFKCNTTDSREIVDCLREVNATDLDFWGIVSDVTVRHRLPGFLPVIDGEMVLQEPKEGFENGVGAGIDYLIGSTFHDAAGFILLNPIAMPALGDNNNVAATPESLDFFMHLLFNFSLNPLELMDIAYDQYPDMHSEDNLTRTLAATQFATDWWFGGPSYLEASLHSGNSASQKRPGTTWLYNYHFNHTFLRGYPFWVEGSHLDDMYTVLGKPFFNTYRRLVLRRPWRRVDYETSIDWMSYLVNFAYTGNPNEGDHSVPTPWPQFSEVYDERLVVSEDSYVETVPSDQAEKYLFLMNEFPNYVEFPVFPEDKRKPVTSPDLENGIETLREHIHDLLGDTIFFAAADIYIHEMVERRNLYLANKM